MKFLRSLAGFLQKIILIIVSVAGIFLAWHTFSEYKPEATETIAATGPAGVTKDTLIIATYNTGYCGLGAEMDFFYEGGTMVRPDKESFDKYLGGVIGRIASLPDPDIIFLQEVDTLAKRSWYSNQYRLLQNRFDQYHSFFTLNYRAWVPMPLMKPMGKVRAGLMLMSKTNPEVVKRHAFSEGYSWPMSLFMLKRCFMEARYPTSDGKQLVVVNTHNSAFSDAADIREKELAQLKAFITDEYAKGNYVIAGGDWNQNPPAFDTAAVQDNYRVKTISPPIPGDFIPEGWQYAWDPRHPTNRDVNIPYRDGETLTTLIDFFVISPNVGLLSVETIPTGFAESDHQPVVMKVFLKN
jgi:endonuclease/exonuclease/phosphatase family metal-dependent hydrolase